MRFQILIALFTLFVGLNSGFLFSQSKIEKLELKLKECKTDSTRAEALNNLAWEYVNVNPQKGIPLIEEAIELCRRNEYIKLKSSCYNTNAYLYETIGNIEQAEIFYLKSIEEKKKIKDMKGLATVYSNVSKIYRRQSKYEKGVEYLKKSILIQDSLKNYYGLGLAYNNLGTIYKDLGDNQKSKSYHLKALENRIIAKDSLGIAYSYVNIGANFNDLGNYKEGIKHLLKGLEILERKKDYPAMMLTLSNVSSTYLKIKNFTLAKKYNKQALDLSLEKNNTNHLSSIYQVKAEIMMEEGNYSESLKTLKKALEFAKLHQLNFIQIEISANIGACYYHLKQYKNAKEYLRNAILECRENELSSTEFKSLCKLTDILVFEKNLKEAEKNLNRAEKLAKKLDSKKNYQTYYRCAINFSKASKNEELLLKSYDSYFLYRDSIMPENIHSSMSEASAKYETDKKEREIQLLNQQKRINALELKEKSLQVRNRNISLISILIILVLFLILIFFYIKRIQLLAKQKRDKAIKETEEFERSRIAKDIHDDLGSGLSKIRFITENLEKTKDEVEFKRKLSSINQTAYHLVDNMRELIWTLNPENNTLENLVIRFREYIGEYLEETEIDFKIEIPTSLPDLKISNSASRNLFSIVKEALQNTVKHANSRFFLLEVQLQDNFLKLKIEDDGSGFEIENVKLGNGLKNMRSRVESLGGEFEMLSEEKCLISIAIPLEKLS
jgi:two-component system sensor histidine kinase UhpB